MKSQLNATVTIKYQIYGLH